MPIHGGLQSPEQQQGCGLNAEQTREFLDTLPRDKLVSLLTSIGATSPRAWQLIQQRARAPMKPAASAREQSAGAGTATPAPPESKRLFIRDLPYTLTSEGLNSAMEEFGPVEGESTATPTRVREAKFPAYLLARRRCCDPRQGHGPI